MPQIILTSVAEVVIKTKTICNLPLTLDSNPAQMEKKDVKLCLKSNEK